MLKAWVSNKLKSTNRWFQLVLPSNTKPLITCNRDRHKTDEKLGLRCFSKLIVLPLYQETALYFTNAIYIQTLKLPITPLVKKTAQRSVNLRLEVATGSSELL